MKQQCPQCVHAHADPAATVEQRLTGSIEYVCTHSPPQACALPVRGQMAVITMYPRVTKDTWSCAQFQQRGEAGHAH